MGEFKAQILGIILVLSIFAALSSPVKTSFTNAWSAISNQISSQISAAATP
ncbi:MAG: hypothetical protein WC196_00835 [Bacilli bacterium]|jgi:hypothetical protein|nr:hypothetical protein [Bacilli bacterium]MDD3422639.1 hypothetical protein [Bacilli bacterium]MDD4065856.1 hypothetical protein [Bacilli bacterium]